MDQLIFQQATSSSDINACHSIRKKVFCEEQNISKDIEFDNLDHLCEHFLIFKNQIPVATARVRKKENYIYKVERVAVLISQRRGKVGSFLIKKIISQYCKDNKDNSIILHSQVSVENFYKNLNFNSYGNQFTEDGILHIAMRYLS
tara:strand:+ start:62 stop:499 length:438 start_codon:yes stop_codon:yes gene_type:complete